MCTQGRRREQRSVKARFENASRRWVWVLAFCAAVLSPSVGLADPVVDVWVLSRDGVEDVRHRVTSRLVWTPELRASFAECFYRLGTPYTNRLGVHPELVTWMVVLDAAGFVVHRRRRSGSRRIARCLERRLRRIRFPPGTPGGAGLEMGLMEHSLRPSWRVRVELPDVELPESTELQGRLHRELEQHRRALRRCARGAARMAYSVQSRRVSVDASQPRAHRRAANCMARVLRRLPMVRAGVLDGWGVYVTSPPEGLVSPDGAIQALLFLQRLGVTARELENRLEVELDEREEELRACVPGCTAVEFLVEAGWVRVHPTRTVEWRSEEAECVLPLLEDSPTVRAPVPGPWTFTVSERRCELRRATLESMSNDLRER